MRALWRLTAAFLIAAPAMATIFGTVRGIVHDPQHRPIAGATVTLKAKNSDYEQTLQTDAEGGFHFDSVPVGEYVVAVSQIGFARQEQDFTVISGTAPVLHFELRIPTEAQSVEVHAEPGQAESVSPTDLVSREEIAQVPGATRTNSTAMITNFVPGAYVTHDQLHVRGGHQLSWLIDGVPIPNTNIASNLGPQIDPKDIDVLEIQRGSYAADFGDRTYGVFNVAPRTGFERNNEGEVVLGFGNFYQSDDQLSFGSHTGRLAYYLSASGNRTNLGLETPTSLVIHDAGNGYGGFGSVIYNPDANNQARWVASLRRDFYQVPFDPQNPDNSPGQLSRDVNRESDAFVAFSWAHTFTPGVLTTISPFYHFNRADFESDPRDFPVASTDNRDSTYAGGQATLAYVKGRNNARAGVYGFGQQDNALFGLVANDGSGTDFRTRASVSGSLLALFAEEQFRASPWLTLSAGLRQTHFSGNVVENATSPRLGAAVRLPVIHWTLRGFYGHFYQAPPLLTASGPVVAFVNSQSLAFIPLHGERDEESQFGVTIPLHAWTLDADTFKTRAKNYFDHNNVGNSDIFFPLTVDGALIEGWELTIRSPRVRNHAQLYLTYSNQVAKARGAVNGGLTDFSPATDFFLLDHDQRNTLHVGGLVNLPWRSYASTDVYYASGFANGNAPPDHLQGHITFDLSLAKEIGEKLSVMLSATNVANRRVLLDNSFTFGGTHFLNPREIFAQVRYRFHY